MDFSSKSPKKEFSKDIASKIEIPKYSDKILKSPDEKSNQKPNTKAKNKIDLPKIDFKRESRNKIQREKIYPLTPSRNKIEPRKIKLQNETKIKIQPYRSHSLVDKITNKPSETGIKNKNLMNVKIQNSFKEYHNEMGKYPNYGRNLKKDFIKWVVENKPEISEKIEEIQNNQEISTYIKDSIQNLRISQSEIASKLSANGLVVSRKSIGNYALEEVFKGNQVEYTKRFDRSLDPEIKERIINRLNREVEKHSEGAQYDSLYRIAKDFPEVSKTMIDKIAKVEVSKDVYRRMWPATSGTVDLKTKQKIRNLIEREVQGGTPRSLRNISKNFPDVSMPTISDLAKEMYPEEYNQLWPKIKKIPLATIDKIITKIKDEAQKENPRTLRDIHSEFLEVGADTIKRIAKQVIPKDIHNEIWPSLTTEIPVIIKNNIIRDILNNKFKMSVIAERNGVSLTSVSNISQRKVFQDNIDAHRKRFPNDKNLEIGTYTHLNLNSLLTRVIENSFNQKYYAEPQIYSENRHPDGLILENDNFLHQRLMNPNIGEYLSDKLGVDPKSIDQIKSTQFDFTNDVSDENLITKIKKYQSKDSLLVIVGTRWYQYSDTKCVPYDDMVKYPENVRVISHNLAAILFGFHGENKEIYDKIIDFNNRHELEALKTLYNEDLSNIPIYNTEKLKKVLIKKNLIREDFNEYFNFEIIKNKDISEKQLDLDHFLNGSSL